jgi:hypothetical protein
VGFAGGPGYSARRFEKEIRAFGDVSPVFGLAACLCRAATILALRCSEQSLSLVLQGCDQPTFEFGFVAHDHELVHGATTFFGYPWPSSVLKKPPTRQRAGVRSRPSRSAFTALMRDFEHALFARQ